MERFKKTLAARGFIKPRFLYLLSRNEKFDKSVIFHEFPFSSPSVPVSPVSSALFVWRKVIQPINRKAEGRVLQTLAQQVKKSARVNVT